MSDNAPAGKGSFLATKLEALEALYHKFGREGLKDRPLDDVTMLLTSKQLQLRDAPKGNVSDEQNGRNRSLELEVADLKGYVSGLVASAGLGNRFGMEHLRASAAAKYPQSQEQGKGKDRGYER